MKKRFFRNGLTRVRKARMKTSRFLTVAAVAAACVSAHGDSLTASFEKLPEGTDPGTVSRRITDQFLSSRPENYKPKGYYGN